jgi:hypothetical protein
MMSPKIPCRSSTVAKNSEWFLGVVCGRTYSLANSTFRTKKQYKTDVHTAEQYWRMRVTTRSLVCIGFAAMTHSIHGNPSINQKMFLGRYDSLSTMGL